MTNEMIAGKIRSGDEKLRKVLWERVERLLYLKAEKAYTVFKNRLTAVGIEQNDVKQECYFVFLEALEAYHPPYKFVTFLEFPFRKMLAQLMKINIGEREVYSESFDAADDDSYSLLEKTADENSDTLSIMDNRTDSEIVRAEVDKLSARQRDVIKLYYFYDKTDTEISVIFGNNRGSVCQLRHRALSNLKNSAILQMIYFQPDVTSGKNGFLNPEKYYLKKTERTV